MIGARELRKHLADAHGITLRGRTFDELVAVHENDHAADDGQQPSLWGSPLVEDVDTGGRT